MGKCEICHEPFTAIDEIDFIELSPRNELGEMTSGIAVHQRCKEEWYNNKREEEEEKWK